VRDLRVIPRTLCPLQRLERRVIGVALVDPLQVDALRHRATAKIEAIIIAQPQRSPDSRPCRKDDRTREAFCPGDKWVAFSGRSARANGQPWPAVPTWGAKPGKSKPAALLTAARYASIVSDTGCAPAGAKPRAAAVANAKA
jgi:hypothetical protein